MIQTGKDKPIVFVSHVEEDAAVASKIKNWLEDSLLEGIEVFVSSDKGINPGDKWEERIIEKLRNCRIALILCTQVSVRQPWINFEAGGAWVKGARVIPLCYHGQRKETLPRPLSSLEALDLSEPHDIRKLLKIIAKEAGLRAPKIDPNELIERLPQRNYEELDADGKLQDIRKGVNLAMAPNEQEVIIKSVRHVPELYYSSSKSSCYGEGFDADELNVEIRGDDNSKSFIAFLVSSIFYNKTDYDTTIDNITLTAFTKDKKTTTILDRIKLDDEWKDFDTDVFTCRIEKNSSKKLFFRFISRDFLVEPEVSIKITLNHTFGDFEVSGMSKFIEAIDNIKWAKGSSGGSEVPTDPYPQHSEPIHPFGDIDGEIPKM